MFQLTVVTAVCIASTSSIAFAASHNNEAFNRGLAQTSATVSAQSSDWTGFYVGGQFGTVDADTSLPLSDFLTDTEITDLGFQLDDTIDAEIDGSSYGLHVGYMADLGSYVIGAELDYDSIDFDEVSVSLDGTTFTQSLDDNTDDTVTRLKLRAGYDAGQFLPYVTAGVTRLDSEDESTNGILYGAGVAFLTANNFLIGGEVLQHQFDDAFDSGVDFEATTFSLRASYKF